MVKSKIILSELVENKDRKFGAAQEYYPAIIEYPDGGHAPVLFTSADIDKARKRAVDNPEDCDMEKHTSFIARIFGF